MNSLSTALTAIRRSPYQSLAAITLLSLNFFIGYSTSFLLIGSEHILRYFETRPQVIAFFEVGAKSEEIDQVVEAISQKEYVSQIKLVTQDEALKIYQQDNQDNPLLVELVTAQILPASLEVSGKSISSLNQVKSDLESIAIVDEVVLQQEVIDSLVKWTTNLRLVGLSLVALISINSLFGMVLLLSMRVVIRRPAILIMRMIGATKWFIVGPFILEGIIYSIIGSLIGYLSSLTLILYLTPWISDFLGSISPLPVANGVIMMQLGLGTIFSMLLGGLAGIIATSRLIKK